MEYYKPLRNANLIIFLTFTPAFFGYVVTTSPVDTYFEIAGYNPFVLAVNKYWDFLFPLVVIAIIISSLILTISLVRQPNVPRGYFPKYFPLILASVTAVITLTLFFLGWWFSAHEVQPPSSSLTILAIIFITLFVLTNFTTAFTLYKGNLSIKALRTSSWILTIVALGMVFNLIDTLLEGLLGLNFSEQELAEFAYWFRPPPPSPPPVNYHLQLLLGMALVSVISFISIWVYARGMFAASKNLNVQRDGRA